MYFFMVPLEARVTAIRFHAILPRAFDTVP